MAKGKKAQLPTLIKDGKKYENKYVAFADFNSKEVIASGKDPLKVIKAAKAKGVPNPTIVFIPAEDVALIY